MPLVSPCVASKISALQFLCGGRVRVTFRELAFWEELLSNDLFFEDRKIPVTPAGVKVVTVYVRDLPIELSNDTVKSAFSTYGEVYSVRHGFFKDFPDLQNGNRLILMSISNPIPSSLNVLGFVCRAWHPGQPVYCTICKESDHSPRTCPLSALCRRCKEPGHVAREGGPSSLVPVDPVPVSVDPVPAPVPVPDPVPVSASEDDGDSSSVSSGHFVSPAPDPVPDPQAPKDNLVLLEKTIVDELTKEVHMMQAGLFRVKPFIKSFMREFDVPECLKPQVTSMTRVAMSKLPSS